MCKILTITNIKCEKGVLEKFVNTAMPVITKADNDGCGYIASTGSEVFTERWLNVDEAFKQRTEKNKESAALILKFRGAIDVEKSYSSTGTVDTTFNSVKAIAMHARASTNTVSLENTHPFSAQGVSLIHNGIISNHYDWKKKTSTCDSESILTAYLKNDVRGDLKKVQVLFSDLEGYYACAVMHGKYLDVFKCERASLSFAVVKELGDAWVWVTDIEHLRKICRKMEWSEPKVYSFDAYSAVRIDVSSGEIVEVFKGTEPESKGYAALAGYDWKEYEAEERSVNDEQEDIVRMIERDTFRYRRGGK